MACLFCALVNPNAAIGRRHVSRMCSCCCVCRVRLFYGVLRGATVLSGAGGAGRQPAKLSGECVRVAELYGIVG